MVHPLNTEGVTYIYQRAESMMGLFYLLTIYATMRGFNAGSKGLKWLAAAVVFCLAGMVSKPVMVTVPVIALVYDRIFWASSWRQIIRERLWFYVALSSTWIAVILIALGSNESSLTAGFGIKYTNWQQYLSVQPAVILHYLKLAIWPYGMALDNGWPFALKIASTPWSAVVIVSMLLAIVWALRYRPVLGFLGLWFFLILTPTSSFFPLADPIFEHRMYLPLISVILAVVCCLIVLVQKMIADPVWRHIGLTAVVLTVAGLLSIRTVQRNAIYQSRQAIWEDVVKKRPNNPRGHDAFASILEDEGKIDLAMMHYKEALRCRKFGLLEKNDLAVMYYNTGLVLSNKNDFEGAIKFYQQAIQLKPDFVQAHNNLAVALARRNDFEHALIYIYNALDLDRDNPKIKDNLKDISKCAMLKFQVSQQLEDLRPVLRSFGVQVF